MTTAEKKSCLTWVRSVLKGHLEHKRVAFEGKEPGESSGAFVTLHKQGELRGCVGLLQGNGRPLSEVLQEAACSAAFKDPRFPPLYEEELDSVEIEVSILSPFKSIPAAGDILLGTHGVLLRKGFRSALFLPQVATEQGWTLDQFLSHLSRKAGLPENAWIEPDTAFQVFTAEVFSEKDFF